MNEDLNVYELDTDALLNDLEEELLRRGYDVREQTPEGVWWLRTDKDMEECMREVEASLRPILSARLRRIVR